jgi:hypothetical protein
MTALAATTLRRISAHRVGSRRDAAMSAKRPRPAV